MAIARHSFFLTLLVLVGMAAQAQTYFGRTYPTPGFKGGSVTPDGGLVLVYSSGAGGNGLARVDPMGELQWMASYQSLGVDGAIFGIPYDAVFNDVAALGDSGYVVVGRANSTLPTMETNQFMIGVFDPAGMPLHAGTCGGTNVQEYLFATAAPGNSAVLGGWDETLSYSIGVSGPFTFASDSFPVTAYSGTIAAYTLDGNVSYQGGFLIGGVDVEGGIFIQKRSPDFALLLDILFNITPTGSIDAVEVSDAPDGSIYAATTGAYGLLLFHTDANGAALWVKQYAMPGVSNWAPTDLCVLPGGKVLVSGAYWLMQCEPGGGVEWIHRFSGRSISSIELDPATGSYYLVGRTNVYDEGWVMRPDTMGQVAGCSIFVLSAVDSTVVCPWSTTMYPGGGLPDSWSIGPQQHEHLGTPSGSTSYLDCISVSIQDEAPIASIQIMPTIGPGPFIVTCDQPINAGDRIEIIDLRGSILRTVNGNGGYEVRVERGGLSPGLYLMHVMRDGVQLAPARVVME